MVTVTDKLVNWSLPFAMISGVLLLIFLWTTKDASDFLAKLFVSPGTVMHIGEVPIKIEVAMTEEERRQGLSGRAELGESEGLLFVFPEPGYYSMWMKDMRFAIDVIWISEDMEVISINEGISPDTYPKTFRPARPAKYALETKSLFVKTFNIAPGQKVRIPDRNIEKQ